MTAIHREIVDALVAASSRVGFEEATHRYTNDGRPVPVSVTGVLKAFTTTDPTCKTLWYSPFANAKPDVLERKRQIGSAAHLATHYHDRGILDPSTVADDVRPYLDAWRLFRDVRRPSVLATELRLVHGLHAVAGTIDKLLWIPGFDDAQSVTIVDLKCGDPKDARTHLQTAAYAELARSAIVGAAGNHVRVNRMSVRLFDDGRYVAQPYTARTDWPRFYALLNALTVLREENHAEPITAVA